MIRVFVRTDETMPEYELYIPNSCTTFDDIERQLNRIADHQTFLQLKPKQSESDIHLIRFESIKFIRVTEVKENGK